MACEGAIAKRRADVSWVSGVDTVVGLDRTPFGHRQTSS